MRSNNIQEMDPDTKQSTIDAKSQKRSIVESQTIDQTAYGPIYKRKPAKTFNNIKSRLIGTIGASLIAYMVYNLLTNYVSVL